MVSRVDIQRLAKQRNCPRCSLDKTGGMALCRRCRYKLPNHMRRPLENIERRNDSIVSWALRAASNYFEVHYKSVLVFGGGQRRD